MQDRLDLRQKSIQDPIKPLNYNSIFVRDPIGLDYSYLALSLSLGVVFIASINKP